MDTPTPPPSRPKKRALALAGGGPVAGFHIGALAAFEKAGLDFQVWSLSCIGAWVGIYYNQLDGAGKAARTYAFFETNAFRDTDSYRGFPVNKAFAPNVGDSLSAWWTHATDPNKYLDAFRFGNELPAVIEGWSHYLTNPDMWFKDGDRNAHLLNNVLAVNPAARFMTSLAYLAPINGLSNIYYKQSSFLEDIHLEKLDLAEVAGVEQMNRRQLDDLAKGLADQKIGEERQQVPEIYHNALRMHDHEGYPAELQLFNNKWLSYRSGETRRDYLPITRPSLCACSALPYIEQTVRIPNDDDRPYSEGALVDTVSFRNLVEDHPDLDEIWVVRIVDYHQVRRPRNLHDSLGNLCEQFAAEVGSNDIELFKTHLRKTVGRTPRVVEIPLEQHTRMNYRWTHENLKTAYDEGYRAVEHLIRDDPDLRSPTTSMPAWA